jgi:DNA-binding beta-propeller fold protein YncE
MELDQRGNLIVLEKRDREVQVISPEGRTVAKIETERGPRQLKKAVDIALDGAGYLYILDEDEGRIAVHDASYNFVAMLDRQALGQSALEKPTTLDVDASGDIYVYDEKDKAIVRLH